MLELENKNPTKERKEENCENHGEQRIEADLCTGDLESSQSTAELQVRATEEKAGREGRRAKGVQGPGELQSPRQPDCHLPNVCSPSAISIS